MKVSRWSAVIAFSVLGVSELGRTAQHAYAGNVGWMFIGLAASLWWGLCAYNYANAKEFA